MKLIGQAFMGSAVLVSTGCCTGTAPNGDEFVWRLRQVVDMLGAV